jgi:predicted phosphohydrolase
MSVFALSDLHLAISTPEKSMEIFGPRWRDYHKRIWDNWNAAVRKEDLVLIPGDITWAAHLDDAKIDLNWIEELPGTKVILKGNHDKWWPSSNKLSKALPPSIHFIYNSSFTWDHISIAGSRLWDTPEYSFDGIFDNEDQMPAKTNEDKEDQEKVYQRELARLETSLKTLDKKASFKIALTHYPPIGIDMKPSRATCLFEKYEVDIVVFGHLHSIKEHKRDLFGTLNNIRYLLAACDYLNCTPIKIL